jgi:cytochrome bd ubiquinol oxidase subunit II
MTALSEGYWNLNTLWFFLIAVLWAGFFFLEGFDFGVGILSRFVGKDDVDRRVVINTIGPVWDGNEVWLLVAGGATFAAFPEWYATLFSGFYLALFLVLVGLIFRAVAFEFRSKSPDPRWRRVWDEALFWGSLVPAALFGVALAGTLRGVPIDARHEFAGSFFDLLHPYALWGGVTWVLVFTLHGAAYLALKTHGELAERSVAAARRVSIPAAVAVFVFLIWTYLNALQANHTGVVPGIVPVAALAASAATVWLVRSGPDGRMGWAFGATSATVLLTTATLFLNLYPRVLVSSIDPRYSLTVFNAASTPYTLTVMTLVAAA